MAEAYRQIDLRGEYKPEGGETFVVFRPSDLVERGIRVSEHAIAQTPTWGEEGLAEYRAAIEEARLEEIRF